jgi:hypothetical protein
MVFFRRLLCYGRLGIAAGGGLIRTPIYQGSGLSRNFAQTALISVFLGPELSSYHRPLDDAVSGFDRGLTPDNQGPDIWPVEIRVTARNP